MGKKSPLVEIACPCCHALLKIDPQLSAVIAHEPPPKAASDVDLDDTARMLREQETRREDKFRKSVEAEKNKEDLFDRLFEENLKKAKEAPAGEKPIRDFDLD